MKKSCVLLIVLIILLTGCQNPSGEQINSLNEVKALAAFLPDEITLNPTADASLPSRLIGGLSSDPFDPAELELDFFNYVKLPAAAIKWSKEYVGNWAKDETGAIVTINDASLIPSNLLPPSAVFTFRKAKFLVVKNELHAWMTMDLVVPGSSGWTLNFNTKVMVTPDGSYQMYCDIVQSDFTTVDYWYWVFGHDTPSKKTTQFDISDTAAATGNPLRYELISRISNSHIRYDLVIDSKEETSPGVLTGSSKFFFINTPSNVYLSEYDSTENIQDIALYTADYSPLGKTDTTASTPVNDFTFNSTTYNLSNYISLWPANYLSYKAGVRTELETLIQTYAASAADGSLLPKSEFTGL
ncbi:MAG: hypothetical protein KAH21_11120 [Spirochaetaceae bacterium]|nr:hypothetical protein [Spirochaetaceae bacterium]